MSIKFLGMISPVIKFFQVDGVDETQKWVLRVDKIRGEREYGTERDTLFQEYIS